MAENLKPDLLGIMRRWGVDVTNQRGYRATVRCPFHDDSGRPNMTVFLDTQTFYCFRCNAGGDSFDMAGMLIFGENVWNPRNAAMFKEMLERINVGGEIKYSESKPKNQDKSLASETVQVLGIVTKMYHLMLMGETGKEARRYLVGRGIDQATMRRLNLGFAAKGSLSTFMASFPDFLFEAAKSAGLFHEEREWLRGRLIFPDIGRDGTVHGMTGRSLSKSKSWRYLDLPGLPKTIWGLRFVNRKMPAILLESLPDAVNLKQIGFQGLAVKSTGIASYLIPELKKIDFLALLPQSDEMGAEASKKWKTELPHARPLVIPYKRGEKDINDIFMNRGKEATRKLLTNAMGDAGFQIVKGK